jgi:hypothetical protein
MYPQMQSAVGMLLGNQELIWIFLEGELIKLALEASPPEV